MFCQWVGHALGMLGTQISGRSELGRSRHGNIGIFPLKSQEGYKLKRDQAV